MIRGAIDYFDGVRVGGWIHSEITLMRDRTILAFVDGQCVGGGKIETFRQDLADAGLGDGYVGFDFTVSLPDDDAAGRTILKLEGSDFALLQSSSSVIVAADPVAALPSPKSDYTAETIDWMREREWLDQIEFDFLKHIATIGLYDRSLRVARSELIDPAEEARRLFELYHQGPVRLDTAQVAMSDIADDRARLMQGARIGIIAIHAPAGAVHFLEGSQNDPDAASAGTAGAIRHLCRPDRMLFLDVRAAFSCDGRDTATIYRAVVAD